MYLEEDEVDETMKHIAELMTQGSFVCGDYTLGSNITNPMMKPWMETLEKWGGKFTYGPKNHHEFHKKIVSNGLTLLDDRDLQVKGSFASFRDNYLPWIPNHRVYCACIGGPGPYGSFNSNHAMKRYKLSTVRPEPEGGD